MKLLCFQAHNDDIVIGAGGSIIKLLNKGWEVGYVYITDSRRGTDFSDFEKNKILRAKEAASERNFLEVKNFWELGVPNGKLCLIKNFVREKFKTKITEIVKEFKPDVALLPSLSEGHPEHRETNRIVLESLKNFQIPILKFILWVYPDIFQKVHDNSDEVFLVDISKEFEEKISAIRKHKSQVRRRHYDKIAESFNIYLSLIFKTKFRSAEIFGAENISGKAGKVLMRDLKKTVDLSRVYKKWC